MTSYQLALWLNLFFLVTENSLICPSELEWAASLPLVCVPSLGKTWEMWLKDEAPGCLDSIVSPGSFCGLVEH